MKALSFGVGFANRLIRDLYEQYSWSPVTGLVKETSEWELTAPYLIDGDDRVRAGSKRTLTATKRTCALLLGALREISDRNPYPLEWTKVETNTELHPYAAIGADWARRRKAAVGE